MQNDGLIIIPKPNYITWEEITSLLRLAFAERAEEGLNYAACSQSAEDTERRVNNGICLIAIYNGTLVGTGTVHIRKKGNRCYGYLSQVGVHPAYKRKAVGTSIREECLSISKAYDVNAVYCDTAEKATKVINWNLKAGWQKIALLSGRNTNYYSVQFRYPISGRMYSTMEAKVRFIVSSLICKKLQRETGEFTYLGEILYRLYCKIFIGRKIKNIS